MATKHGNRVYIQVLLEPFRGQLFLDEAARQEAKPSALIRDLVYNYLAEHVNEETYCDADSTFQNYVRCSDSSFPM
jgi:hypothetical protein